MAKVHISTVLNSSENGITKYDGYGVLKDNRLTFYDDKIKVVIEYNNNTLNLERSNDEYRIVLPFEISLTKEGIYDIKCDSIQIPVKVTTNNLCIEDGLIHVEYSLLLGDTSQGDFVYDIEYEVSI